MKNKKHCNIINDLYIIDIGIRKNKEIKFFFSNWGIHEDEYNEDKKEGKGIYYCKNGDKCGGELKKRINLKNGEY